MKKIDIGQTIGILANLGVLLGILLLVYELSLNREMMRSQTRTDLAQGLSNHFYLIAADPELSTLVARANTADNLTDEEMTRYRQVMLALFRYYENVHYQYRIGLYDEDEFAAQRRSWQLVFRGPVTAETWCQLRGTFSPDFVAEIDELFETSFCAG